MKTIKRLWNYILTNKHPIGDFIWQLDADVDELNRIILAATEK